MRALRRSEPRRRDLLQVVQRARLAGVQAGAQALRSAAAPGSAASGGRPRSSGAGHGAFPAPGSAGDGHPRGAAAAARVEVTRFLLAATGVVIVLYALKRVQ